DKASRDQAAQPLYPVRIGLKRRKRADVAKHRYVGVAQCDLDARRRYVRAAQHAASKFLPRVDRAEITRGLMHRFRRAAVLVSFRIAGVLWPRPAVTTQNPAHSRSKQSSVREPLPAHYWHHAA